MLSSGRVQQVTLFHYGPEKEQRIRDALELDAQAEPDTDILRCNATQVQEEFVAQV